MFKSSPQPRALDISTMQQKVSIRSTDSGNVASRFVSSFRQAAEIVKPIVLEVASVRANSSPHHRTGLGAFGQG
jgi:hypothetical protein